MMENGLKRRPPTADSTSNNIMVSFFTASWLSEEMRSIRTQKRTVANQFGGQLNQIQLHALDLADRVSSF